MNVLLKTVVFSNILYLLLSFVLENEMPPAVRTRTQRTRRTKPSNQGDYSSAEEKKTISDKTSESSSCVTSLNDEKTVPKNCQINAGGDCCQDEKNQEVSVDKNELNVLKDIDENDCEPLKKRITRTKTSRSCKRGVTDGDESKSVAIQRLKRSKKNNVENTNENNVALKNIPDKISEDCCIKLSQLDNEETSCKSTNNKIPPSNSDLQNKLSDVDTNDNRIVETEKSQSNKAVSDNITAADKLTATGNISKTSGSTDSNPIEKVGIPLQAAANSVPSSSVCREMKADKIISMGCSSNVKG